MIGKHYKPSSLEFKCYNCNSKDITTKKSKPWTYKWRCNKCKKYHFGIAADFMSGALHEDVYVSDEEQS